jgi:hypothetical protein
MVRAEDLLVDRKGVFVERFGIGVATPGYVKDCEVLRATA